MRTIVSTTRCTDSSVSASGFSTKTALPASSARHTKSACEACRVTTNTASRSGSAITDEASVVIVANPNLRCALTADSERVVATVARWAAGLPARCGSSIDVA